MSKKNPYRFNIAFDPNDPLQKKAAEILNAQQRYKLQKFVTQAVVIACQTELTMQELFTMQSEFLCRESFGDVLCPGVDTLTRELKQPKKRKSTRRSEKAAPPEAPTDEVAAHNENSTQITDNSPPKETPQLQENSRQEEPDTLNITFDDSEDAEDSDLDEFLEGMKAFGGDY